MTFLTFASVITSCTVITSKPIKTVVKQPVVLDIPNVNERIVLVCDVVSEIYVCDRLETTGGHPLTE
ncbi:MAG TPA: hypothetical protein EYP92_02240 [Candidatus Thioglobus sp.]|nr:hypothetical protein [Candidatus Thioglobus sp.]